jgi:hypothetical protein
MLDLPVSAVEAAAKVLWDHNDRYSAAPYTQIATEVLAAALDAGLEAAIRTRIADDISAWDARNPNPISSFGRGRHAGHEDAMRIARGGQEQPQ